MERQISIEKDAPSSLSSSLLPVSSSIAAPSLTSPSLQPITQSTSTSSGILPPLPIELKRKILRFCDPSTLAKTSLVSLAFLEMPCPLLYAEVELVGFETMSQMFCSRDPLLHQPQLEPFLSLRQIERCTITQEDLNDSNSDLVFRKDRLLPSTSLLSVESLTLQAPGRVGDRATFAPPTFLLALFDPTSVRCIGLPSSAKSSFLVPAIRFGDETLWPSLQTLTFRSCISSERMESLSLLLEFLDNPRGLTIVLDLVESATFEQCSAHLRNELVEVEEPFIALENVKEVVVRVSTSEEEKSIADEVSHYWEIYGMNGSLVRECKSRLRFEVVGDDYM